MPTICLCADDYGLHAGVNDAVLRLARMGRVHAIGCLVGAPAFTRDAVDALRTFPADAVDVGLHLDLTEFPLWPGSRRPLGAWIRDSLLRRADRAAVRAEIRAQLDAFERAFGRQPAFVDGHQHVHQLWGVRQELIEELVVRYGSHTPWLRCTRAAGPGLLRAGPGWLARFKARVIEQLGARGLSQAARRAGITHNSGLLGVYDFEGGPPRYRDLLAGWLAAAADGDLLMCHPAVAASEHDAIGAARCVEYEVLSSAAFTPMLAAAGVHLAPLGARVVR